MVGRGASSLGRAGVFAAGVDPCVEVVAAVKDAAAEAEAAGAGAEVAPVAEGGDGGAQHFGGFGDGEQVGVGTGGGGGHGGLPGRSRGGPTPTEGVRLGPLVTPHGQRLARSAVFVR